LVAPSPRAPHLSVHALPERRIGKHRGGLGQSQADQSSVFGHRASGPISSSGWPKSPGPPRSCRVPNSRKRTLMPHHSSLTT